MRGANGFFPPGELASGMCSWTCPVLFFLRLSRSQCGYPEIIGIILHPAPRRRFGGDPAWFLTGSRPYFGVWQCWLWRWGKFQSEAPWGHSKWFVSWFAMVDSFQLKILDLYLWKTGPRPGLRHPLCSLVPGFSKTCGCQSGGCILPVLWPLYLTRRDRYWSARS